MPNQIEKIRSDRRPIRESNLVSEQPGFFILFLGLFISIVVGLSVKTAAQSDWFHSKLKEAIANVGKEWRIEHGAVGLYFKDGIRPAIGLYLETVKIASQSRCYMRSGGFAQKIKIPLSIINYLIEGQLVSEIEIEGFKIEVTDKIPICNTTELEDDHVVIPDKKKKNQISIVDHVERSQLRNEIQVVRINKLEIFFPHDKYNHFLMSDIIITNKSAHPKILFLEGDMDLNPFINTGEGKALASLKIEYNEFPEKIIKSNLLGSLREGYFSMQLVNRLDDEKFQLQSELKNVSLSLLKGLIPNIPKDLNLKSNWLSLKIYSEGSEKKILQSSTQLKDVLVNGDLGEATVDEISFPNGIQNVPNKYSIKLRNLDVTKVAQLTPEVLIPKQIESLGTFDGQFQIINNLNDSPEMTLDGQLNGLEIVFSANGIRKTEKLSVGKLGGQWKNNRLLVESLNMNLDSKPIDGFINLKSKDQKLFEFEAQFRNVQLSNDVSELVTGSEKPLRLDDFSMRVSSQKEILNYKAQGKLKSFFHKYLDASNVVFTLEGAGNRVQEIDIKADQLQFTDEMQKVLVPFALNIPMLNNKPRVKITQSNESIHMKLDTVNGIRMSAELKDQLSGTLKVKDQEWKIYGTRDDIKIDKK